MKMKSLIAVSLMCVSFPALAGDITVAAAASLTDAFKEIATGFEKQHPQTKVRLTFASSGTLLQQLRNGAPIDVLATADQQTMNDAQKLSLIQTATRRDFAANQLVLITPAAGKVKITSLQGLTQPAVKHISLGNPAHTPAGRYAEATLKQQKLWDSIQPKIINTANVRQALDYVARGETEAGFVFSTDAASAAGKVKVAMKVPTQSAINYPIAVTGRSKVAGEAKQFLDYVNGKAGKSVLRRYGFQVH